MILVTGGNGFIGTNFIIDWLKNSNEPIVNIDNLSYSSSRYLDLYDESNQLINYNVNINDSDAVEYILTHRTPRAIIHFAAESHVDNSIKDPLIFYKTNILGTANLLECVRKVDRTIRFINVSTDEVYGSLGVHDRPFTEETAYSPNSPYSASKAAGDHLTRAYNKTYGIDTVITNCSNNYGKYQHDEKFIPTVINSCLNRKMIPIYGNGSQIRDWLHVSDHCGALRLILESGKSGEKYNIGGGNQYTNLEIVHIICDYLEQLYPNNINYRDLINFVDDRPGHDTRYDVDYYKLKRELSWNPTVNFKDGIYNTLKWYLRKHNENIRNKK